MRYDQVLPVGDIFNVSLPSMQLPSSQSPLSAGTVLQSRYTIVQLLGQGGFARTYLAQDQERFRELCVLKEFIPSQSSTFLLEKARELFQREAAILYQIQHSQIPRFRATFEFGGMGQTRLFLVQDYVAGKTYRGLLSDRKKRGLTFTEAEVRTLLAQILPVLAYIHSQGIIHRDISPENLILRLSDQQPVLIDFGVVKEVVTRCNESETESAGTAVGKLGFAPVEQLQAGRVYPSSDLYSLAVTVLVLLTGQEPQVLFEDHTATWDWQAWTCVSQEFAEVLNRMLCYKPGDRYQSAAAVLTALQALPPPPQSQIQMSQAAAELPVPHAQTLFFESQITASPEAIADPEAITANEEKPLWRKAWLVTSVSLLLAIAVGGTAWVSITALLQSLFSPTRPSPVVLNTSINTPFPLQSSTAQFVYSRPLQLSAGGETTVSGGLQPHEVLNYQLQVQAGQELKIVLQRQAGLNLRILDPAGGRLLPEETFPDAKPITLRVNRTGLYSLQLIPSPGKTQRRYQLTVSLPKTPAAIPVPPPTPLPLQVTTRANRMETETIQLSTRAMPTTLTGQVRSGGIKRYLVPVSRGQTLAAVVVNGAVTLNIRTPAGQLRPNGTGVLNWQSWIAQSGTYQVDVVAIPPLSGNTGLSEPTSYVLKLTLRNSRL